MNPLDPNRHAAPLSFFLAVNRSELKWIALNSFFYACGTASLIGATYALSQIVDLLQLPTHASLMPYLIAIVGLLVCYEAGFRTGHVFEIRIITRMRERNKKVLFDHTASLSFGFFADRFAGEIAHKISKTADAMERLMLIATNTIIEEGVLFLISGITLVFISPLLGLFILLWCILFLIGIIPYARYSTISANEYAVEESKATGAFVDLYSNIATVKVYGQASYLDRAHRQIEAEVKAYRRLGFWSVLTFNYEGLSIIVLGTGLLIISSYLFTHALLNIGGIVFIAGVGLRLLMNVWDVGRNVPEFIRNRGEAAQNLKDLIIAPAILDGERAGAESHERVSVEYKNVTFGYSHDRPILDNFSFSIKAGEKVGIVGLSGAGKTTFANLLLRFFDVTTGAILLNGEDIRDFTQEFLRSHISYISQDTSLFHATIAENIAYGASAASQEDVLRAAHLAYADEFIETLPQKYESIVGERGIKLSGGQRQRIAVARAILADRPFFLLDEATSALDSDSEAKIQKGLEKLMEGKTVIAIAHRLSTLSRMDRIIFLEAGQIIEDGTHDELLTRNGKYAQLWHMQAGGFLPGDLPETEG